MNKRHICKAIAMSLREFGYPDATDKMIADCWDAFERGEKEMPHGIIGMFAERQFEEIAEARPDILKRGTQ